MKKILAIVIIGFIHFMLMLVLSVAEFTTEGFLGFFPKPGHNLVSSIFHILSYPLIPIANSLDEHLVILAWTLGILNSLLWAVSIYLIYKGFRKISLSQTSTSGN